MQRTGTPAIHGEEHVRSAELRLARDVLGRFAAEGMS